MTSSIRHPKSEVRPPAISTYWERTQWPLQSLYFLLPLLLLYEIGIAWYASDLDISARSLLRAAFSFLGVTGYLLPGLLAVAYLFVSHMVRRDPWEPEPKLWVGMAVESVLLAVPLLVLAMVAFRGPEADAALVETGGSALNGIPSWQAGVVLSVGAGIYEELLFRVIVIALMHLVLVDFLQVPDHWGAIAAVAISAVAFSLYHFIDPSAATWAASWEGFKARFQLTHFAFYAVAGVYLAMVYVLRGFGIVAATHALYDVAVVTLAFMQGEA